ncbi:RNA-binding S4 domain-containing protein [Propioniciclava flava]|jgi:ribosome-associated protein
MGHPAGTEDVAIGGDMIRLGQFLQVAGLLDTGGQAKQVIADGEVRVNGETETHRGRQLHHGDVVSLGGVSVRVQP